MFHFASAGGVLISVIQHFMHFIHHLSTTVHTMDTPVWGSNK